MVGKEGFRAGDEAAGWARSVVIAVAKWSALAQDEDRVTAVGVAAGGRSQEKRNALMRNPGDARASGRRAGFGCGP